MTHLPSQTYRLSAALTLTSEAPLGAATLDALRENLQAAVQRSYDEGAITGDLGFDEALQDVGLSGDAPRADVQALAYADDPSLLIAVYGSTCYLIRSGLVRFRVGDNEYQMCLREMLQSVNGPAPVRIVDATPLIEAEYRRLHPDDPELLELCEADEDALLFGAVERDPAAAYGLPDAPQEFER
ncbi:hypothetical protein [Deinococcus petrolearius]|uniref:Uncharacterized protein n=1 Tax=Deinococcus petrolearius TaxID=1751295 RepID=A0ABW1DNR2_9DEIO